MVIARAGSEKLHILSFCAAVTLILVVDCRDLWRTFANFQIPYLRMAIISRVHVWGDLQFGANVLDPLCILYHFD